MLDDFLNILASSIGGLTNPTKLANTFESVKHEKVSRNTLASYLEYICESFLMEQATRYDVKGKKYIESLSKYYFADCGLRNARLNWRIHSCITYGRGDNDNKYLRFPIERKFFRVVIPDSPKDIDNTSTC